MDWSHTGSDSPLLHLYPVIMMLPSIKSPFLMIMKGDVAFPLCLPHTLRRVAHFACAVSSVKNCSHHGANELNVESFNCTSRRRRRRPAGEPARTLKLVHNQVQRDTLKPWTRGREMKRSSNSITWVWSWPARDLSEPLRRPEINRLRKLPGALFLLFHPNSIRRPCMPACARVGGRLDYI